MKPKKQFKPQNLRTLLSFVFFAILVGSSFVFYMWLGMVKDYSIQVNQRLVDAEASGQQVDELQVLESQLAESDSLVGKANQLFANQNNYQSQALTDIKNYADAAGLSIESTRFDDASAQTVIVKIASPAPYNGLITFLANVESNLPKMQVSALNLGHAEGGGANSVTVGEIKIDISVR